MALKGKCLSTKKLHSNQSNSQTWQWPNQAESFLTKAHLSKMFQIMYKISVCSTTTMHITKISTLLKSTSGLLNVWGTVKWKEEAHIPSNKTDQMVGDGTLTNFSLGRKHYFNRGNKILQHNRPQTLPLLWENAWPQHVRHRYRQLRYKISAKLWNKKMKTSFAVQMYWMYQ